jgi:glutamine amidotransferase
MVTIVDYGSGNLRSVQKAVERLGVEARISDDPGIVAGADRLILPGVGAFGDAMRALNSRGLVEPITAHIRADRPFLGICMGLQLLFETGWEGGRHAGLGILPGEVTRFAVPEGMKVPHMGWNEVHQAMPHPLWAGIADATRFYFVHSYFPQPADPALVAAFAHYPFAFCCAVARENLFAVQFHPEKSHDAGLRLLANFVAWDPAAGSQPAA